MPKIDRSLRCSVEHRRVDVAGGLRVHVAEAGEGPPLLLLHGWPQHWWVWRDVIPVLAQSHRVICADLRGHGWTGAPDSGYAKEQLATDAIALLDALGIERVGLMGHDWGGYIAFLLCLREPERIERLLALNTGHPLSEPSPERALGLLRFWHAPVLGSPWAGERLLRWGLVAKALEQELVPRVWSEQAARIYLDQFLEPARARAASQLYRSFLLQDAPALVSGSYRGQRLRQPVLVLHGSDDPVLPLATVSDLPKHADDARVEPVEGVAHFIVDEVPELVAERAAGFFALSP